MRAEIAGDGRDVVVPSTMDALISKVLTFSDAKEHRIVLPKLLCEEKLVAENANANASPGRDCTLQFWAGSESVSCEETVPMLAAVVVKATSSAPVAEHVPDHLVVLMDCEDMAKVPAKFWSFRYRIAPCGKSFIHTIHDQQGFFQAVGVAEGDRITLCRWKSDGRLQLLLRRAASRPAHTAPLCAGVAHTANSHSVRPILAQPEAAPSSDETIALRAQQRRRLEATHAATTSARTERSPPPKRALKLYPNARIRVGSAFQAAIPRSEAPPAADSPDLSELQVLTPSLVTLPCDGWTQQVHDDFARLLLSYGKDMPSIARAMGISTKNCVEYFYWRKSNSKVATAPLPAFVTEPDPFP